MILLCIQHIITNITHVDVSSFASKTNLAVLKTEVDKIDADNAIENDVVKKTNYNTKVTTKA